ncbi:hypothetical protein J5Y04_16830 [Kitasatospora sp. RG8]|nr:hypothetical protein [Kitasatospora sp. RG8]
MSDQGRLIARYDKRYPSKTELSYPDTPGRPEPTVFEVDGVRLGLAICIEANFPELFAEYERLDVDCALLSVMVDDPARATVAQAYGTSTATGSATPSPPGTPRTPPAASSPPGGRWLHRAPTDNRPALALADLHSTPLHSTEPDIDIAVRCARPWRRLARADLYTTGVSTRVVGRRRGARVSPGRSRPGPAGRRGGSRSRIRDAASGRSRGGCGRRR